MSPRHLPFLLLLAPLLGLVAFIAWPLPPDLLDRTRVSSVRIEDRQLGLLRELRSGEDARALPLPPGPLPPEVAGAFVAAEDRRFGRHPGIDPLAIARTLVASARAGHTTGGASTITQQLARRLVPRRRTLVGKLQEALWAVRLTVHLPRERILREYLDRVALGNGVVGVETAAQLYFRRPAAHLSTGQAALLAGMAAAPARFDPYRHPARAAARQRTVLRRMERTGALAPGVAARAAAAPLDLAPLPAAFRAPHFAAQLASSLERRGLRGAVEVVTTIDPALQADVERAIGEELAGLAERRVGQAALIVIDNPTGEVLAYAGSADFFDDERGGQNDGVRARRQPGSALKPFAYGLALASGMTAAEVIPDVEARFASAGGDYRPRNYDRRMHGPVRLRAALANSYNVPAVRVCERLGPARVLDVLRAAGLASLDHDAAHYGLGLVLGDGEVSPYELARAYRGLARGGVLAPLVEIRAARDAHGRAIALPAPPPARRFLPENAVALLTDILADEPARVPAFGAVNALRLPFPVAVKTGTSRAHADNWVVGFTKERTVAAWAGNFDGSPMLDVTGITGAGPLFRRAMLLAMRGIRPAPLVDRSRFDALAICPLSGARAGAGCPGAMSELFLPGTAPTEPCAMHRVDPRTARRITDLGPRYAAWTRGEALADPDRAAVADGPARLLAPGDGDEFRIDPGLPLADQSIVVRALAPQGVSALQLRTSDGTRRTLRAPFTALIAPHPGAHRVELWLPGAAAPAAVARFTVLP